VDPKTVLKVFFQGSVCSHGGGYSFILALVISCT